MFLRLVSPQEDVSWGCPSYLTRTLIWEVRFGVGGEAIWWDFLLPSILLCPLFFCVCPCLLPWASLFFFRRSWNLPLPGSDGPGRCCFS